MEAFDARTAPLDGTCLIEASAGTGKTYAIAGLFLRLILEGSRTVERILVVTFTEAATEELRDRIRAKLAQAKNDYAVGSSEDPLIAALIAAGDDPDAAIERLGRALGDFDQAAIYTIHGFCQRVLQEHAFETEALFDAEVLTDPSALIQSVADDFWRRELYQAPVEVAAYALKSLHGPQGLVDLFNLRHAPDTRIVPRGEPLAAETLLAFRHQRTAFAALWPVARTEVASLLCDPGLKANIYGGLPSPRNVRLAAWFEEIERFAVLTDGAFPPPKAIEYLSSGKLARSTKKGHLPPRHACFERAQRLLQSAANLTEALERHVLHLKSAFLAFADHELKHRKARSRHLFFDDLLQQVRGALRGSGGASLAEALRRQYQAALVDEFQDTDGVQCDIFMRLFGGREAPLYLIGDPKQAIYGFRGADIFTYMAAARDAGRRFTLARNYRSAPGLVTAVNTLFGNRQLPFVYEQIAFMPVAAAREPVAPAPGGAPLWLGFLQTPDEQGVSKGTAEAVFAAELVKAIHGMCSTEGGAWQHGDMAVLVRANRQARLVKEALTGGGIPAVIYNAGNVFESTEAREIESILAAVAEPSNPRRLKAALATSLLGASAAEMLADEEGVWWNGVLQRFHEYHEIWVRHGFVRMFRQLMVREGVKVRLLGRTDGERRLTNALHIVELLHRTAIERKLGVKRTLKWLRKQFDPQMATRDEHQLRLESDARAVKILTIHKSKGLEFEVVFCPFCWDRPLTDSRALLFHDPEHHEALTLDLGSDRREAHGVLARREMLAENLRLLYVAVTRARQRCVLFWGKIDRTETSALAYLLHATAATAPMGAAASTWQPEAVKAKGAAALWEDLVRLAERSHDTIGVTALPGPGPAATPAPKADETPLAARRFEGRIDNTWGISSYSAMIRGQSARPGIGGELPDYDAGQTRTAPEGAAGTWRPEPLVPTYDIFSFPRGARAGIFFHALLEESDFAVGDREAEHRLVADKLSLFGFARHWEPTITDLLASVRATVLPGGDAGVPLAALGPAQRINELEFYFPLNPVGLRDLQTVFETHKVALRLVSDAHDSAAEALPTRGFLKGFIDLVFEYEGRFYLIDWKSNYLGPGVEDYRPPQLAGVMHEALYTLQYHLYVLALHQYLRRRCSGYDYESHFGGAYYVFLRGLASDPQGGSGIFRDRPSAALVHALGRLLIPGYAN